MKLRSDINITRTAPDVIEVTERGGCYLLFGALLLHLGVFLLYSTLHHLPNTGDLFCTVLLVFSVLFLLAGISTIFGRQWVTLDLTRYVVVTQWGLVHPIVRKSRSLQDFEAVTLSATRENHVYYYQVALSRKNSICNLTFVSLTDYGHAYEKAAQIASFLSFPLIDSTTDHRLDTRPEDVAHPMQARQRVWAEERTPAIARTGMKSGVLMTAEGMRICIPKPTMNQKSCIGMLSALPLVMLVIAIDAVAAIQVPSVATAALTVTPVLILIGIPLAVFGISRRKARLSRTIVTASANGIRIEEQYRQQTRTQTFVNRDDIVDLDCGSGSSIIYSAGVKLKTRHGIVIFGAGLSDAEVEYLAGLVKKALGNANTEIDGIHQEKSMLPK